MNIEEKLWDYIDGTIPAEERSFVENLVHTNTEWKAKYDELMDVHQLMKNHTDLEEPSLRFTQNVMEEISRLYITPAASSYINKNIIRGIGLFFITTIVAILGYAFGQIQWPAATSSNTIGSDIENVDWSGIFSGTYMNIFIMINILLALMLLDMYLTKRKRKEAQ